MDVRALKPGLIPLFLPVPPMFESSIGYRGDSRFVAFSWGSCDELCYMDDALNSGTLDSAVWKVFISHSSVRKHFFPFDFGTTDFPALHWLLLDRKKRRFSVGEREAVESFLEACSLPDEKPQMQDSFDTTISLDEFIVFAGDSEKSLGEDICPDTMMRRLQEQQAVCSRLREWLDRMG